MLFLHPLVWLSAHRPRRRRSRIVRRSGAPQCHGGSALPLALLLVLLMLLLLRLATLESNSSVHGRSRCLHAWQHATTLGARALQCWLSVRGSSRCLRQRRRPAASIHAAHSPVPGRSHCSHHRRIRTSTRNKEKVSRPPRTSESGARLQQRGQK